MVVLRKFSAFQNLNFLNFREFFLDFTNKIFFSNSQTLKYIQTVFPFFGEINKPLKQGPTNSTLGPWSIN